MVVVVVFVARSCLTLATPWTVASSVHGIFQIRILEWVAISFSRGIFPTQESNRGLLHCSQRESERALEKMGMSRGSEGGQRRLATGHRVQSSGRLTDRFRAGSPGAMHRHAVQPARRTRSSALCGREPWAVVAGARSEGALGAGGGTSASQSPQTHSRVMWRGGRAEERRQRGRHGARDRVGRGGPPW